MNRNICGYQRCNKFSIIVWSMLFLFIMVKCSPANSTPIGLTPTATESRSTSTQTPTATPTIRASIAPLPTWTPTFTPLPPLSPNQAAALVKELFENNGGCQLPCWWGITPGESVWDLTSQFFSTFASDIVFLGVGNSGSENFAVGIRVPNSLNKSYVYIYEKNNIITDIQFDPSSDEENFQFQLHQLFKGYGKPAEIYIYVLPPLSHPGSEYVFRFRLVLHFPDQHIIALYSFEGQPRNDTVYVCSPPEVADELFLSSPNSSLDINSVLRYYINDIYSKDETLPLPRLEDFTNMSIDEFYDAFADPNSVACLETPESYWVGESRP